MMRAPDNSVGEHPSVCQLGWLSRAPGQAAFRLLTGDQPFRFRSSSAAKGSYILGASGSGLDRDQLIESQNPQREALGNLNKHGRRDEVIIAPPSVDGTKAVQVS
jgi:hypothetical protein